jgi:DNA-binding NarL/FixJ family response regulator
MSGIAILLANPHPILRTNLRTLLEREAAFHVVAEAANGREAIALTDYKRPDVVILDVSISVVPGIETARAIHKLRPEIHIIFHGSHTDEEYVGAAFDSGARGYVAADDADSDLLPAVKVVAHHGRFISPRISIALIKRWCGEQVPPVEFNPDKAHLYSQIASGSLQSKDDLPIGRLPELVSRCVQGNQLLKNPRKTAAASSEPHKD